MKRLLLFSALLTIVVSCLDEKEKESLYLTDSKIIASFEGFPTKTVLETDANGTGTIYWKPADEIKVFYGTAGVKYTSQNTENATTAIFETTAIIGSTESASSNRWGLYPYDAEATCDGGSVTTTISSTQCAVPNTFDDDLFVTLAHSQDNMFTFYNVCGGIKFSLNRSDIKRISFKGNNDEILAGKVRLTMVDNLPAVSEVLSGESIITLTPKDGSTFLAGTNYYIVCLPVTMSGGFTITFETDSYIGTFVYTDHAVTIKRSVFGKKEEIDTYATFVKDASLAIDLSASGTANCYVVPQAGFYKFDASVKGNSTETVGTPASAEVLWETFGTGVKPNIGDIVNSVTYANGYVCFDYTGNEGNALIAVKDESGTILWSWHLWCTSADLEGALIDIRNNAGTIMDRNLGATTGVHAEYACFSLLYQYGRKDPFLGGYYNNSKVIQAESTGEWSTVASSGYEDAIKSPTTFLSSWGDEDDSIRWTEQKNMYDPCPPGYRVPDGFVYAAAAQYYYGESSLWSIGTRGTVIGWYNGANYTNPRSIWFPNTNALYSHSFLRSIDHYSNSDRNGAVWTCGGSFYSAMYDGYVNTITSFQTIPKKRGNAVRCVTESSPIVVETESVTVSADTVNIAPYGYFDLTATVYPANANVNQYYWNDTSYQFTRTDNEDGSARFTDTKGTIGLYRVGALSPLAYYGANDEWRILWNGPLASRCVVNVCPPQPTDYRYYGGWYLKAKAGDTISFSYYIGDDNDGNNDFSIYVDGQLVYEDPYHYSSCSGDFSYTFEESFSGWVYLWWGWRSSIWDITTTATVLGRGEPYPNYPDYALNDRWISKPSYWFEYCGKKLTFAYNRIH